MIKSFRDKRTASFYEGERVAAFEPFRRQAERRLQMLDDAVTLRDLAGIPGNRLESLSGIRRGQHSMRINRQWRICFSWRADGAHNVEIVDYH
jgi:proteic killer suppression protein